ncbi:hypothetical protein GWK47_035464 [Chionoecetes opilio]|uniref:Uncharacterized protein n=1 Tax=Chionoecetes opilio TaxID=41210 RepID=A0A8J4YNA0_CHIOP|nr:hypothetical protein GWK47_035464 [Chionoecetes opilio]
MCGSHYDLLVNKETSREHVEVNVQVPPTWDVELRGQHVVVAVKLFTGFLSRGRLLSPSQFVVSLIKDVCYIYRWLWKEKATRYALFSYTKPKAAFQKVIATLRCANNHCFLEKVYFSMAGALFNAFTSNYGKEKNSELVKCMPSVKTVQVCLATRKQTRRKG